MVMDINRDLDRFKGFGVSLKHNPKQTQYLIRDITGAADEVLWTELQDLRGTAIISFREMGRRLKELQFRYSKKGIGDFEKRYTELGFKKMEVYTLINKYDLYQLDTSKEDTLLLVTEDRESSHEVIEGELIEEIVCTADKVEERLGVASQRTVTELIKSPSEVRDKYYSGEINTPPEIKEERERLVPGKIIQPAVIEDDRRQERVRELTRELKDIDSEIGELLEAERKLKRLREQRTEVIEELSKVNNLKLDFNEDPIYKSLIEYLTEVQKKKKGPLGLPKINLKDDWWKSRAYEWWQKNRDTLKLQWFEVEERYLF